MNRYRKNSGIVDAVQFTGDKESLNKVRELLGDKVSLLQDTDPDLKTFSLIGNRDSYTIYRTDWIVRDDVGNSNILFFVVSDNIFKITHKKVS